MNNLATLVRERRKDMALTQKEFGELIGVTNGTISKVEKGAKVGSRTLKALSNHLQMSTRILRRLMNEDNEQV